MPAGDQGLSPQTRITKRSQYLSLRQRSRRWQSENFLLLWRPNRMGFSRLGITVTRRVGNAVVRNRIKRQVRERFRLHRALRSRGLDMVLIAKHSAGRLSKAEMARELEQLFDRLAEHHPGA